MTKYIYGVGGQKSRANKLPKWGEPGYVPPPASLARQAAFRGYSHVTGWTPRWYQARGAFWWALAAALAALVAL